MGAALGTGVDRTAAGFPVGAAPCFPACSPGHKRLVIAGCRPACLSESVQFLRSTALAVATAAFSGGTGSSSINGSTGSRVALAACWKATGWTEWGNDHCEDQGAEALSPPEEWHMVLVPSKSGVRIEPPHTCGTPEFFAALNEAEAKHKAKATVPGTFGALVRSYRSSSVFLTLKARSRRDYLHVLDWLRGLDGMPLAQMDSAFVAKLRDKAFRQRKRRFANYVLSVISVLFTHGVELRLAKTNPAREVRKVRRPTELPIPNRAWTVAEKQVVLDTAPPHLIAPIAIARWTGLREGDIIKLARTAYRDGALNLTTASGGSRYGCHAQNPSGRSLTPCPRTMRCACASARVGPRGQKTAFVHRSSS